jgi:hypothetical protein
VSEPVRTCVGCGRKAAQRALVRFAAVGGQLEAGRRVPGRGAYTCRSRACFERATTCRGFVRTLRTPVEVRPELVSLYTDVVDG